jgi:pyruvate, water dikinase
MGTMSLTTGLPGLDAVLKGLLPGDNIVWEVNSVEDYRPFVKPYCQAARSAGRTVLYFRFARHEPLLTQEDGVEIHELDPDEGFEKFIGRIHTALSVAGSSAVHVFDCLSDLAVDWSSDGMLANFFRLTCPYVYELQSLACFAVLKDRHSPQAIATIANTTQILLDVYQHNAQLYVHPIKVQQRHSPTMYMLHEWDGDTFRPVTESGTIAKILTSMPSVAPAAVRPRLGVWTRAFLQVEESLEAARRPAPPAALDKAGLRHLMRMLISRDKRVLALAEKYLTAEDVLKVWRRTLGTGLIGGKSVGMLLARAILRASDSRWEEILEEHDSFFIGSDVFYTYLIQNGCWWLRTKKPAQALFQGAEEARRRILTGTFTPQIQQEFAAMLDYFGQSPIIVRSSSLLEDAFGNSFAGKYDSVFCVNQGSPDKRLDDFLSAVRTVYASAMSERALRYRARRGILDRDEQMALLVQRVSGAMYGGLFFPQIAGVGLSYNPYAWNERIDPRAGLLRVVSGLGTRAVERTDEDYTRVVALNAPELRPEAGSDQVRRYTQRKMDVLDLTANQLVSKDFPDVVTETHFTGLDMVASRDDRLEQLASESGLSDSFAWLLTFDKLLRDSRFVEDMRSLLKTVESAYGCPVDTEFTANISGRGEYRINLLQCRPLQVQMEEAVPDVPEDLDRQKILLEAHGVVVGQSRRMILDRLICVVPEVYGHLSMNERYRVARLIGRVMHPKDRKSSPEKVALLGPGRWGTTTPALGVPVSYAEINRAAVLCEIVAMHEGLVPEVSLGTHFFNELVESNTLYFALFPTQPENSFNADFFNRHPNRLESLVSDGAEWAKVIKVIDAADLPAKTRMVVAANNPQQRVICYLENIPSRSH